MGRAARADVDSGQKPTPSSSPLYAKSGAGPNLIDDCACATAGNARTAVDVPLREFVPAKVQCFLNALDAMAAARTRRHLPHNTMQDVYR